MEETTLNPVISAYIEESNAHNFKALTASFKINAVVEDEGLTHRGIEEIRHWMEKTHFEYRFTLEVLDFTEEGGETIVTCLVTGTFPGSPIRQRFFFTFEDDKIAALTCRA